MSQTIQELLEEHKYELKYILNTYEEFKEDTGLAGYPTLQEAVDVGKAITEHRSKSCN